MILDQRLRVNGSLILLLSGVEVVIYFLLSGDIQVFQNFMKSIQCRIGIS